MLNSVQIQRRQSEIRQKLAELAGKDKPTEDETRSMVDLDTEYRTNETRYRAALIAEDQERREAGEELETRSDAEWQTMLGGFEVRQVAMALDHGHQIDGQTAEIIQELRSQGAYQGIPVPWQALERRAGETVAGGTPAPVQTR
ncbi:MAG: phage major capsid protein, partial [Roseovarius sp.]